MLVAVFELTVRFILSTLNDKDILFAKSFCRSRCPGIGDAAQVADALGAETQRSCFCQQLSGQSLFPAAADPSSPCWLERISPSHGNKAAKSQNWKVKKKSFMQLASTGDSLSCGVQSDPYLFGSATFVLLVFVPSSSFLSFSRLAKVTFVLQWKHEKS